MKKILSLFMAFLLLCGCGVTAYATGTDSGSVIPGAAAVPDEDVSEEVVSDESVPDENVSDEASEDVSETPADGGGEITLSDKGSSFTGSGISFSESTVTITDGGEYTVSGSLENGQLVIAAPKSSKVELTFDGVEISCDSSAALYVQSADKLVIDLAEGSKNVLCSTGNFVQTDGSNVDAALFSKEDLTIKGSGALEISCETGHGIVSKDDLKISGGDITITAADKGISSNDSLTVKGGTINITSADDALNCDGDVTVSGGELTISTGDDGIHSDATLSISGGKITVTESYEGLEGLTVDISGGDIWVKASDDGINAAGDSAGSGDVGDPFAQVFGDLPDQFPGSWEELFDYFFGSGDDDYYGSGDDDYYGGGYDDYYGDDYDDYYGDDFSEFLGGLFDYFKNWFGGYEDQPDSTPDFDSHIDNISNRGEGNDRDDQDEWEDWGGWEDYYGDWADGYGYTDEDYDDFAEWFEGWINDGWDDVPSSDFGEMPQPPMGGDPMADVNSAAGVTISGGNIVIDAGGDGIDSNGAVYITGGSVFISGSENGGNSALDYATTGSITGGSFIASGSADMAMNFDSASTQCSILYTFPKKLSARTEVTLADADGNVIASYTPSKSFNSILISVPGIEADGTYTITAGSSSEEISMNGIIYGAGGMGPGGETPPDGIPGDQTPPDGKGGFGRK